MACVVRSMSHPQRGSHLSTATVIPVVRFEIKRIGMNQAVGNRMRSKSDHFDFQ